MDNLKDIKDIVEIKNFGLIENLPINFLFTYLLIAVLIVLVALIIFDLSKKKRKKVLFKSKKELAYENLNSINYDDTKDIVYKFSQNYLFFTDEESLQRLQNLEERLLSYKYKKEVEELSGELKDEIKNFIKGIKC